MIAGLSPDELAEKLLGLMNGTEGQLVSDTSSTAAGTMYGWLLEADEGGDSEKAVEAFKGAGAQGRDAGRARRR